MTSGLHYLTPPVSILSFKTSIKFYDKEWRMNPAGSQILSLIRCILINYNKFFIRETSILRFIAIMLTLNETHKLPQALAWGVLKT